MKRKLRVVSGVWVRDGRLMVHEIPRADGICHETSGPAACWCEPEVYIRKFERVVLHQDLKNKVGV